MQDRPTKRLIVMGVLILLLIGLTIASFFRSPPTSPPSPAPLPRMAEGTWRVYSEEALVEAKAAGKPVLIDFYADWCGPCKLMDKTIFRNPRFLDAAKDFLLLRADVTNSSDPRVRRIARLYQVDALPMVVFLDRAGRERQDLRVTGVFEDWEAFLEPFLKAMELTKTGAPIPPSPPEKK